MMPAATDGANEALPGTLRLFLLLPVALVVVFVCSAPWTLAGRTIDRLTPALAVGFLLALAATLHPPGARPWPRASSTETMSSVGEQR